MFYANGISYNKELEKSFLATSAERSNLFPLTH